MVVLYAYMYGFDQIKKNWKFFTQASADVLSLEWITRSLLGVQDSTQYSDRS